MNEFITSTAAIYLWIFAIYHVITGIVSYFFSDFSIRFYKTLYGFQPTETEQFKLSLKPWGSLALVVGLVACIVLTDIHAYRLFLLPLAALLLLRILYRFRFRKILKEKYSITNTRNFLMLIIQFTGIVLFIALFYK